MYEDKTYDAILTEALGAIESDVMKTEGSLVYNAVSALAFEINRMYIQLDYLIKQIDPETADFDNLKALAAQRAVYPSSATSATVKIQANTALPIGVRFSLRAYNYKVTELISDDDHTYAAICEETGTGPNELRGELIPIDYVDGLKTAEITELLVAGTDADGRDELYEKYLASLTSQSFGGNVAAYKEHLNAISGVGGTKVYPVWEGAGTVKCVLIGSDWKPVSDYLLEQIRQDVDPEAAKGYGWAPINHTVTIESVKQQSIDVTTTLTFSSGYSWAVCKDDIIQAMSDYLTGLCKTWGDGTDTDYIMVYISRLESAVLDVQGVLDVSGTTLNGSGTNLALDTDAVPALGEVTPT